MHALYAHNTLTLSIIAGLGGDEQHAEMNLNYPLSAEHYTEEDYSFSLHILWCAPRRCFFPEAQDANR